MRRAAYAGASVAAAAAVILRAFHDRPNFYSATVYLGQSTACRMILLNMLLLTLGTSMYGLQRLLYGPLRAIEIEQLWDKAWYAITETALAMTTFRDEVGGYFFLMFMTLLAGKVWGWIGEGRVETLEQQPPANPKTFYARLITSLILSVGFDLLMARYCLRSILDQHPPRAGMMIMFVFEFIILAISSISTLARFLLAGYEKRVVQQQTKAKIEERRAEIRAERAAAGVQIASSAAVPNGDIEIDENEIDVPGWQEKGKWVLFLDLATDFLKLVFYLGFFMVLIMFAGIPIHMFRDLFITTRSFLKRINDYLKYRNATRDMNSRYPDATVEELHRDGTCIICREEMRPWRAPNQDNPAAGQQQSRAPIDERQRPKKLPCGHILHFGCLRSWLERQQVCPTCRRSVLAPDPTRQSNTNQAQQGNNQRENQAIGNQHPGIPGQPQAQPQRPQQQQNRPPGIDRVRTFNLGGFRLTLATGRGVNVRDALNRVNEQVHQQRQERDRNAVDAGADSETTETSDSALSDDLQNIERRIIQEVNGLNVVQREVLLIRAMQNELARLRGLRASIMQADQGDTNVTHGVYGAGAAYYPIQHGMPMPIHGMAQYGSGGNEPQIFGSYNQSTVLNAGDQSLPEGLTLPEGWSLLPLQRMDETIRDVSRQYEELLREPSQAAANTSVTETNAPSTDRTAVSNNPTQLPQPVTESHDNGLHSEAVNASDMRDSSSATAATNGNIDSTGDENYDHIERSEALPSTDEDSQTANPAPPQWSSAPQSTPARTSTLSDDTDEGQTTASASSKLETAVSDMRATDKGKARAPTVEDTEDDDQ